MTLPAIARLLDLEDEVRMPRNRASSSELMLCRPPRGSTHGDGASSDGAPDDDTSDVD